MSTALRQKRPYAAEDDDAARAAMAGVPIEIRPGRIIDVAHVPAPGRQDARRTIFFTHGGGGNKAQWRHQFREAVRRGYGAVAWDALGHGDSADAGDPSGYRGRETLADYTALLARFATARNVLVGHSMGGRLTLALLAARARAPSVITANVERAVLVGSAAPGAIGASTNRGVTLMGRAPPILLRLARPLISAGFRRRAWDRETPRGLMAAEQRATRRNRMETIRTLIAHPAPLTLLELHSIEIPVLVVTGEHDRLIPPAVSARLIGALPHATLHVVRGAAHQVMVEQPDALNAALFGFLETG